MVRQTFWHLLRITSSSSRIGLHGPRGRWGNTLQFTLEKSCTGLRLKICALLGQVILPGPQNGLRDVHRALFGYSQVSLDLPRDAWIYSARSAVADGV